MNNINLLLGNQFPRHLARAALAAQPAQKPNREMTNLAWQNLADTKQPDLKARVGNETDSVQIVGKKRGQLFARALVNDQPCFDTALAEDAEIVERENRLAPKARRRMLSDDENAKV